MNMTMNLTAKQESFCHAFIQTGNASEAYRLAYSAAKMKQKTVAVKACELLKNGNVTVRVSELRKDLAEKFAVSDARVIDELARIAFADIRRLFTTDGRLKQICELDKDFAAAISNIDIVTKATNDGEIVQVCRIRLSSKLDALSALAKHLGLFQKDNSQGNEGFRSLAEAIRRADRGER